MKLIEIKVTGTDDDGRPVYYRCNARFEWFWRRSEMMNWLPAEGAAEGFREGFKKMIENLIAP